MTSMSKNAYSDKLDDLVNKYNNTYNSTSKTKPLNVKSNAYIKEINDKDPKFKIGDNVRTSKYKNSFAKGYVPKWSEEDICVILCCGHISLVILKTSKLLERFMKKNCKK